MKLERKLNLIIGVILFDNLYYLSALLHLPNSAVLGPGLLITAWFLQRRIKFPQVMNLLSSWFAIGFVLLSVVMAIPEKLLYPYAFNPNDLIRAVWYAMFFAWTYFLYNDWVELKQALVKMAVWALSILIIQGFVENAFPLLFRMVLMPDLFRVNMRIGGTLVDSNAYAMAVVTMFTVLSIFGSTQKKWKKWGIWLLAVLSLYMVDLSGSRMGLLLIFLLLVHWWIPYFRKWHLAALAVVLMLSGITFKVFEGPIGIYAAQNPNSTVSRVLFNKENTRSSGSDQERTVSLNAGLAFAKSNFYIWGPGAMFFMEAYVTFTGGGVPVPHNGILFLICQYGLLAVVFFYLFFLSGKRAWHGAVFLFFAYLMVGFNLLPNSCYYCSQFLLLFLIDIHYLREHIPYANNPNEETHIGHSFHP